MKNVALLVACVLLTSCNTQHESPFNAQFRCEVPEKNAYPLIQTDADLVKNMRELGLISEQQNFIVAQWLTRTTTTQEQREIAACPAEIQQKANEIIGPQYQQRIAASRDNPARQQVLTDLYTKWQAYMRAITPNGVDQQKTDAFNQAVVHYPMH